jgi:tetratricopeptide (TPR) repeat protein
MQNIMNYRTLLLFLLVWTASSCSDSFIELIPEDQQSSETFFKTEAQFRQAVTAAYPPLRNLLVNDYFTAEMRSDNTHYEYYAIDRGTANKQRETIADFVDDPTDAYSNAVYFHCYTGISRANIVINRLVTADLSDNVKNSIAGEAKFLRAFNYFKLVRYFGAVPVYLDEVTNAPEAFLPRATADEVYRQIIADAQDAIAGLDPPAGFPQTGKATKGSATMLLAEVYMTQKKYAEAETLLKTLPAMGYQLLPDYAAVFSTANKNSKESIFEVQYMQGAQGGQQSNFIYLFLPRTKTTMLVTGVATNNTTTGGWNTPTQDMIDAYEAGDKRKDASIGIAEGTYDASSIFTISANKSVLNYTPAAGKIGVPYIKKYLNPHTIPNNTDDNWPIYRYADALLLLAEALNEQGKSTEAVDYVNAVRDRAFGAGVSPIVTTDQNALREVLEHERRVELAFENHRWHDLVRTGSAIDVMNAHGISLKQIYSYLGPDTYQVNENRLLFPIPQAERDLNRDLTQNDGYPQ